MKTCRQVFTLWLTVFVMAQTEFMTMPTTLNDCRKSLCAAAPLLLLLVVSGSALAAQAPTKPSPATHATAKGEAAKVYATNEGVIGADTTKVEAAKEEAIPPDAAVKVDAPVKVKFRPPATGAPSVRLTGGTRGSGDSAITLDVLAPDDIGVTTQEQPSLFWCQSKPAEAKFELTLLQENRVKPLVQVMIDRSAKAGIQRLKLADHDARLVPGVEYQWVVALITDPDNRSTDLVASGVIKRIEPTAELKESVRQAPPSALPGIYAEAGIWYDALSALEDQIDAHPEDEGLRAARTDLLQQVGLKAASTL